MRKAVKAIGLVTGTTVFILMTVYTVRSLPFVNRSGPIQAIDVPSRVFTVDELKKYDGSDPNLPIYLAFEGMVYDVTIGKNFYQPGGVYHFLAGTDGTTELRIAGGGIIQSKYKIVGRVIK